MEKRWHAIAYGTIAGLAFTKDGNTLAAAIRGMNPTLFVETFVTVSGKAIDILQNEKTQTILGSSFRYLEALLHVGAAHDAR